MIFPEIALLLLVSAGAWWLTGIDKTASGESKRHRYFARALRCVAVVFLVAAQIWLMQGGGGLLGGIAMLLIIPLSIALVLRSSVSELFTGGFLRLMDPTLNDRRPLDPGKSQRYQDEIARLIQNGRRDDAIRLCEELKRSGEVDLTMLENTLEFLGVLRAARPQEPLTQAAQRRVEGKVSEAEQLLKSLLKKNPADVGAAMMLIRIYAQDLRDAGKANEVLRSLSAQPHVPASHLEFARRSIDEWRRGRAATPAVAEEPPPESVEDLLARGFFGSAVENLEKQIQAQPDDFGLRLRLAEVYAVNCKNPRGAEKIVQQIESAGNFSPQQIESARAKLSGWGN